MLGVNAALDGRPEEALRIAETAYSRAPWFKPIVGLYAAMLKRAGQLDRAALLIEPQALRSSPRWPALMRAMNLKP